ncbi:hypothetical protein PHYC_00769 [Phycisphaerales bacterium]|nr:hypothetical protein PHYC_00769 [Phycisphaerales bacterium]
MSRGENPSRLVERLRKFRAPAPRDRSIGSEVDRVVREAAKRNNSAGGMSAAWQELAPARGVSRVEKLTPGGVLVVRATDAGARYELDVWLRSGGLEALRARCKTTLRRVKIELGGV